MNDNILASVKKLCNISEDDKSFDQDLIIHINSALMTVMQEWHGMDTAFRLEDGTETWDDILGDDVNYEGLKDLIGLKVRLVFDPPSNSALLQSINEQIKDLEWRMYFWKDLDRIGE